MLKTLAIVLAVFLAVFFTPLPAKASVWLEDMTWTELRDAVSGGATTVIIPVGGTEQSGPHLALGKHNARVRQLSQMIAEKLGHTLVAPIIAYVPEGDIDPPTEHMRFPGTISLTDATFTAMLEQAGRSLRHGGFKNIVFIGDHGGYQQDLVAAAGVLNKEWKGQGRAIGLTRYYQLSSSGFNVLLRDHGLKPDEIGTHAAAADTSLELATMPAYVRADKLTDPQSALTANGVYGGSPAKASSALGEKGIDLIVSGTVSAIQSFIGGSP